ncbi:MAG: class I SAM-dependent methyltransferase [Alphaproteobacteria bacterium]
MKAPAPGVALSACKVCGADAPRFGVADFNKHCSENRTGRLPKSGVPVHYYRCGACSFIFTDAFDEWSADDFAAWIYNADYIKVDPDYAESRPRANADTIIKRFGAHRDRLSCLDYGGGGGLLAERLRQADFRRAETYDLHNPVFSRRPEGRFDLLTCFEVFEHENDPHRLLSSLDELIGDDGVIYFSTLLQPEEIERIGLSWWYIGPRNGHVSIYSRSALNLLLLQYDLDWGSINQAFHLAWRGAPAFAAGLIEQVKRNVA